MRRPNASRHRQRGIAAVEFAIVVVIALAVATGLVEIGRSFWYYDTLAKATRDGARQLSAIPLASLPNSLDSARTLVTQAATAGGVPAFDNSRVNVTCAPVACNAATAASDISRITVAVDYPLTLGSFLPLVAGGLDVSLTPATTMPYLW